MSRPLGSKNKRPSGIAIGQSLAAKGIDLAERILHLADITEDDNIRLKALELLCRYSQVVPTSMPNEADDAVNPAVALSDDELAQAAN